MLIIIAAMDSNRLIGKKNSLPRYIPEDLKRFKELTLGHTVIMGRKTYESLPEAFRPLPHRHNIIISSQKEYILSTDKEDTSVEVIHSLDQIMTLESLKSTFIIGGSQVYKELLAYCNRLYITEIKGNYEGDTYFPEFKDQFIEISREIYDTHDFVIYERDI